MTIRQPMNNPNSAPNSIKDASHVMISVSGPDHPGITARITEILAESGAELHDIEQVVVCGQLSLGLRIGITSAGPGVLKELVFAAKELGVSLDFFAVDGPQGPDEVVADRYVLTVIGPRLGPADVHALASTLAQHDSNIAKISRLSHGAVSSIEIQLDLPLGGDPAPLKKSLLQLATSNRFDIALQREGLFRRSKRLVVLDMDSTLIPLEFIDEIAKMHGVATQVSAVTERAMRGEMDYDESLRQRLGLLKGLEIRKVEEMAAALPLTEGAETLIRVLRRLGYRTAVISGGFSVATEALKKRLGLDHAHSNVLEVEDGKLTGRVVGPVVNGARKAELLQTLADKEGILLDQVIAVGDGANDILMLERAGLGIAFHAKAKLREAADTSISTGGLDSILYLLGISKGELDEVMKLA